MNADTDYWSDQKHKILLFKYSWRLAVRFEWFIDSLHDIIIKIVDNLLIHIIFCDHMSPVYSLLFEFCQ